MPHHEAFEIIDWKTQPLFPHDRNASCAKPCPFVGELVRAGFRRRCVRDAFSHSIGVPWLGPSEDCGLHIPDGISVRVFASAPDKARGLPVRSGTLEILAFDGPLPPGKPLPAQPFASWSFNPAQLRPLASSSALGIGYDFTLPWPGKAPAGSHVTVLSRYAAPHLPMPALSGSATIALRPR